jgi:hypothetical protein
MYLVLDQLPSVGCEIVWCLLHYNKIHSLKLLEMLRLSRMITPCKVSWLLFSLSCSDWVSVMVVAKS